jgi:hypothetical protein
MDSIEGRVNKHGGLPGFIQHVAGEVVEAAAARDHLLAVAERLGRPEVTDALRHMMSLNQDRLLIWADQIRTPEDLAAKHQGWQDRGLLKGVGQASSPEDQMYAWYQGLMPDQKQELKVLAVRASRGTSVIRPAWVESGDLLSFNLAMREFAGKLNGK